MYATPVIYPLSSLPVQYRWIIAANPMTPLIECFRYGFLGAGTFEPMLLMYSTLASIFVLGLAMLIFNQTEKNVIDTV
jgi:lipopolysaccharide transport system permease protein